MAFFSSDERTTNETLQPEAIDSNRVDSNFQAYNLCALVSLSDVPNLSHIKLPTEKIKDVSGLVDRKN